MNKRESYSLAIEKSRKCLEFLEKQELSDQEKHWVVDETARGFMENVDPDF